MPTNNLVLYTSWLYTANSNTPNKLAKASVKTFYNFFLFISIKQIYFQNSNLRNFMVNGEVTIDPDTIKSILEF